MGRHQAVASTLGIRWRGFPAWFLARTYHLALMPGTQRRLRLLVDWTVELLFGRDTAELGQLGHPPALPERRPGAGLEPRGEEGVGACRRSPRPTDRALHGTTLIRLRRDGAVDRAPGAPSRAEPDQVEREAHRERVDRAARRQGSAARSRRASRRAAARPRIALAAARSASATRDDPPAQLAPGGAAQSHGRGRTCTESPARSSDVRARASARPPYTWKGIADRRADQSGRDHRHEGGGEASASGRCGWCSPSCRRRRRRATATSWRCCGASASAGARPRRPYRDAGRDELADAGGVRGGADRGLPARPSCPTTSSTRSWRGRRGDRAPGRPRDMGQVIKHVMAAAGGRADGKRVSTKVKEALS